MAKLGKKARKFAKKHLQSVLKTRRKLKSTFKRKHSSKDKGDIAEDQVGANAVLPSGRNSEDAALGDTSLDCIFSEDDNDLSQDCSDSDGFLSEDLSCEYVTGSDNEDDSEKSERTALFGQNKEIYLELSKQMRKLDRLREKDPDFSKFLESHNEVLEQFRSEEACPDEEGETNDHGMVAAMENGFNSDKGKVLTNSTIDSWCQLIMAEQNISALCSLVNAYRAACHHGSENGLDAVSFQRIQTSGTFCKIIMFMLHEANGIFRRLLGISSSNCKIETILELKNTSKWKTLKPLIKSYIRSTLFLLNQVTDSEILIFALTQLRASIIFFAAFPSLLRTLVEVAIQLWATGGTTVSSRSFLIIHNMAFLLSSECLDTCLIKAYKAFISHGKFVEIRNLKHTQFLLNSLVKLYSLDVPRSLHKSLLSIHKLAKILQQGLKTKNKEALKKIYSWQYFNCIDLWVKFISANIRDHDLKPLLYLIIQIINGVAHLFPGPRYIPLRLKCIQMLNYLSSCSGVFIPVTSLVLDSLEYGGSGKPNARPGRSFDISAVLKVPKQWLKLREFQEEIVLLSIELLSVHFAQWSYHISFPELAIIPLIRLRKFQEKMTAESLRRPVKRLIDQVERNVEFVQKKREEVSFSPKDQESVESFLQLTTCSSNVPFTQYYASVIQKSLSRCDHENKDHLSRPLSRH